MQAYSTAENQNNMPNKRTFGNLLISHRSVEKDVYLENAIKLMEKRTKQLKYPKEHLAWTAFGK